VTELPPGHALWRSWASSESSDLGRLLGLCSLEQREVVG
jgi:hypothetical protein